MPWVSPEAISLFQNGFSAVDVYKNKIKTMLGDPVSQRQARAWHQYWREGKADTSSVEVGNIATTGEEISAIIKLAKNKFISVKALSASLDRSEQSILNILREMQGNGYNVEFTDGEAHLSTKKWVAQKERVTEPIANSSRFKLAVTGDWHVGSIYEQHTHLMDFLQYALDKGYRHFCVPGDLTEGMGMRIGHELGMYTHSTDGLVQLLHRPLKLLASAGATVYIIGGNHDFSVVKNCKTDPIWQVCQAYDDVYFMGYDRADVPITDRFSVRMFHPDGGGGNPIGKVQKAFLTLAHEDLTEQLSAVERESPNVGAIFVGHLHISSKMRQGSRVGYQIGCFQGESDFLTRHSLTPTVGGHLFEFLVEDSGRISSVVEEEKMYNPIKDDYKNYEIPSRYVDEVPMLVQILGVSKKEGITNVI